MKKFLFLIFSVFVFALLSADIYAESDLPKKFDLREKTALPEPGCQGGNNICWAYSFLGSVETRLMQQHKTADLSEWYMVHSAFTGNWRFPVVNSSNDLFLEEGSNIIAASVMTGWRGIARGNDVPFGSSADFINKYNIKKSIKKETAPEYIITEICGLEPWVSEHRHYSCSYIKELIYSGYTVSSTCSMSEKHFESTTSPLFNGSGNYSYKNDPYYHAVLITGWDDNFSRENFSPDCRPEGNGAWIARNSYGTEWGDNGYFYISYEDTSLLEAVTCTGAEKNRYKNIYQYDEYGWSTSLPSDFACRFFREAAPAEPNTGYMANIFEASSDEYISAAAFYTTEENAEYEVSICTRLSNPSDPLSGTNICTVTGTQKYTGYHTVNFSIPAQVFTGDLFSVIVKLKNPSSNFTVPAEACIRMLSPGNHIISNIPSLDKKIYKNESFISTDGRNWFDMFVTENGETPVTVVITDGSLLFPSLPGDEIPVQFSWGNVCIKAFASEVPEADTASVNFDINGDGSVTAADLAELIRLVLSDEHNPSADLNNDGLISSADVLMLKTVLM